MTAAVGSTPGATLVMCRSDLGDSTEAVLTSLANEPAPTELGAEASLLLPWALLRATEGGATSATDRGGVIRAKSRGASASGAIRLRKRERR